MRDPLREVVEVGAFQVDLSNERLTRGGVEVHVRPKAFAVLRCLLAARGKMVRKDDIIGAVWPEVHVSETVLKVCIRELRRAFGDDPRQPSFIATSHTRGYCFVHPTQKSQASTERANDETASLRRPFVGRSYEMDRLHSLLEATKAGARNVAFVTGDAGVGKTWLIDRFASGLSRDSTSDLIHVRVQCLQATNATDPFEPVLAAIAELVGDIPRAELSACLANHAPTVLAQLPALLRNGDRELLAQRTMGASRTRMIREFVGFFKTIARQRPLVLIITDLQFADAATLDVVVALCRDFEPVGLLLVLSYRVGMATEDPRRLNELRREFVAYGRGVDLPLGPLSEQEIRGYLELLFGSRAFPAHFIEQLGRHTQGHPLFLATHVDALLAAGFISKTERSGSSRQWQLSEAALAAPPPIPQSLRALISSQAEALPKDDAEVLDVIAVADSFHADLGANVLGRDVLSVEAICEELVRRNVLLVRCEGQAGEPIESTQRYQFRHTIHQSVFYDRIGQHKRSMLHRRIGEYLEQRSRPPTCTLAATLVLHFERGCSWTNVIRWLCHLAHENIRRFSSDDALKQLERARGLLERVPLPERITLELATLNQLAQTLAGVGRFAIMLEVLEDLRRAAHGYGVVEWEVRTLHDLVEFVSQSDPDRCLALVEEAVECASKANDHDTSIVARGVRATWKLLFGERGVDTKNDIMIATDVVDRSADAWLKANHTMRLALLLLCWGAYDDARKRAIAAFSEAMEIGSHFRSFSARLIEFEALRHLGEWGKLSRKLESFVFLAHQAEYEAAVLHGQFLRAVLFFDGLSYSQCLRACEELLPRARALGLLQCIDYLLVVIARCHLELGGAMLAEEIIASVEGARDPRTVWYECRMLMLETQGMISLSKGAIAAAAQYAERMRDAALTMESRGQFLRAEALKARIAATEGRVQEARALLPDPSEPWYREKQPLMALRIHDAACNVFDRIGDIAAKEPHARARWAILERLKAEVRDEGELFCALDQTSRILQVSFV